MPWDIFRNSGCWTYETEAELQRRAAAQGGEPDPQPDQPGRQRQPEGAASAG